MNDLLIAAPARSNLAEYTVSELSQALKRSIEDDFGYVRVRGEISGFKRHGSGHCYFALKDADAVLDAVCWRMTAIRLGIKPEDGMEVVCTGRLTTYPGRSKYQLIVERDRARRHRRAAQAARGAAPAARRRGPVRRRAQEEAAVSAGGHRHRHLADRARSFATSCTGSPTAFPRRVLIWPVAVQGEGAAAQVAAAIAGFNRLAPQAARCRGPI